MRQKFNIVKVLKKRLEKCFDYFDASGVVKSLHLSSYLSILLAIVHDRKESTLVDEYWAAWCRAEGDTSTEGRR